ncbi:MAG: monovalent cation/H+ antiporter subunit family protein [Rickettsiales bacterium]|jgi:multicomponent Na+:H+ antiporter subunit D|nr:monovalent cation/H+ antiporter subunit family protein [Rickettsiales bacterium]
MLFTLAPQTILFAVLSLPLLGALFIGIAGSMPRVRDAYTLLMSSLTFIAVLDLFRVFGESGVSPRVVLYEIVPGVDLAFQPEPLGMVFALLASFLWAVTNLYAIGYMRANHEQHPTRFFLFFALAIAFTLGIAFAANLFTLFVFYEVLTVSTYVLVAHHQTEEAKDGARTYVALLMGTSLCFLLPAIIWTWYATGRTDFVPGGILQGNVSGVMLGALLLLYMYGIGKAALMPFHRWLPAAMVAPTPVSALLHAVAVVTAGVFTIVKVIIYIFGVDYLHEQIAIEWMAGGWLVYLAGVTVVLASVVALKEDHLKKRLAYSTISQLSYVIMAVAIFTPKAVVAAVLQIAAHAVAKITLFLAAGSIYTTSHKKYVSELDGIGKRMPWTMGAFTIAALSMIGLPPMVGFISKWYIVNSALDEKIWIIVLVIILSTMLNAMYFLPVIYRAFFVKEKGEKLSRRKPQGEAPLTMVFALMMTAILTVYLFLEPDVVLHLAYQLLEYGWVRNG